MHLLNQKASHYQAELLPEDTQLIAATLLMAVNAGIMRLGMAQHFSAQFLSSEPQFTFADIEILCLMLRKMSEQIGKDRALPASQRFAVQQRAALIIQKLERGLKG